MVSCTLEVNPSCFHEQIVIYVEFTVKHIFHFIGVVFIICICSWFLTMVTCHLH